MSKRNNTEIQAQSIDPMAEGIRDMFETFRREHPHATKIIIYAGIMIWGGAGILAECKAIKG